MHVIEGIFFSYICLFNHTQSPSLSPLSSFSVQYSLTTTTVVSDGELSGTVPVYI